MQGVLFFIIGPDSQRPHGGASWVDGTALGASWRY